MIVKISPVGKGASNMERELTRVIDYIIDESKVLSTRVELSKLNILTNPKWIAEFSAIVDVPGDDGVVKLVSAYRCPLDEFEANCRYLQTYYLSHNNHKKDLGPVAWHVIISWPQDARISDEDVHRTGCEILSELGHYPGISAAHIEPVVDDKGILRGVQKHCHLLICAYPDQSNSLPHKISFGRHNLELRELNDKMAILHGQTIIVNPDLKRASSYYAAILAKNGESWIKNLQNTAETIAGAVYSLNEYQAALATYGYSVSCDSRGKLRYHTRDGHEITEDKLGRQYTLSNLNMRWSERDKITDKMSGKVLYNLAQDNHALYATIPLGGLPRPRKGWYFSLGGRSLLYDEPALRSYFAPEITYAITDEHNRQLTRANGQQILDYLGVVPKDTLAHSETKDDYYFERLDKTKQRAYNQSRRTCETHTNIIQVKHAYEIQKQKRRLRRYGQTEVVIRYDYSRRQNGEKRTVLEWLILVVLVIAVPSCNIEAHSFRIEADHRFRDAPSADVVGRQHDRVRLQPNEEVACPVVIDEPIQRRIDMIRTLREEGLSSQRELSDAEDKARYWCNITHERLAIVQAKLEENSQLMDSIDTYLKTEPRIREIIQKEGITLEQLKTNHEELVHEYERSVQLMRSFAINNWGDLTTVINEYKYLQALEPELLQAAAADYEHWLKLRLALETSNYALDDYKQGQNLEPTKTKKQSKLDEMIQAAYEVSKVVSQNPKTRKKGRERER